LKLLKFSVKITESSEDSEESKEESNSVEKQLKNRYDLFQSDEKENNFKRAVFSAWAGKRDGNLDRSEIFRYLLSLGRNNRNNNKDNSGNSENKMVYKKAFGPWAGKRGGDKYYEENYGVEKRKPWGGFQTN
jgi:hypothetical protein